jgi:hypothetical protein
MSMLAPLRIPSGINLVKALRIARDLGCYVQPVRRTGEIRVFYGDMRSGKINCRRKDAPMHLIVFLRRIAELN